jgi:hypothetical protein
MGSFRRGERIQIGAEKEASLIHDYYVDRGCHYIPCQVLFPNARVSEGPRYVGFGFWVSVLCLGLHSNEPNVCTPFVSEIEFLFISPLSVE